MLDSLRGGEVHRPQNRSILLKNQDDQRAGMADASTSIWKENRESVGKGVSALMGGWLIWLLLGGLFLFLMFRGGGCCGGAGGPEHPPPGAPPGPRDGAGGGGGGGEGGAWFRAGGGGGGYRGSFRSPEGPRAVRRGAGTRGGTSRRGESGAGKEGARGGVCLARAPRG